MTYLDYLFLWPLASWERLSFSVDRFSVQKLSESLQTPRDRGRSAGVVQPSCPSYSILSGFRGAGQRGKVGPGLMRHTCVWLLLFYLGHAPNLKKETVL